MSLNIEPNDIKVDTALIQRVPYRIAAYYQALPLGYEDGFLSLAIAHPENETALIVLQDLLGLAIIPVRVPETSIREALTHIYGTEPANGQKTLVWCARLEATEAVKDIARAFVSGDVASAGGERFSFLSPDVDLGTAMTVAREGQYNLIVMSLPENQALTPFLSRSPASMLLIRRLPIQFRRILMVLRGYSSDWLLLDWLSPLLQQTDAAITLLPLDPVCATGTQPAFAFHGSSKEHLKFLLRHPVLLTGRTMVKFRQGQTVRRVVDEITQGSYDLVVIGAEGYGDFVGRILCGLDPISPVDLPAVFVGKPPVTPQAG